VNLIIDPFGEKRVRGLLTPLTVAVGDQHLENDYNLMYLMKIQHQFTNIRKSAIRVKHKFHAQGI
jgi:hypothetical protein